MAADNDAIQQAVEWLQEKWTGEKVCPVCTSNNWVAHEDLITPVTVTEKWGLSIGTKAYPQVMVACKNCGYIMHFSTGIMGIQPDGEGNSDGE